MVGTILALGYACLKGRLPGPAIIRGALYGLAPWLMAQVVGMPMMGIVYGLRLLKRGEPCRFIARSVSRKSKRNM